MHYAMDAAARVTQLGTAHRRCSENAALCYTINTEVRVLQQLGAAAIEAH